MQTRRKLIVAVAAALFVWGLPAAAQEAVTAIEEEWELQLGAPKPDRSSPQLVFGMSPVATPASTRAVFTLNQRNAADSRGGGLQLQLWQGETLYGHSDGADTASLNYPGERVAWTQRMSVESGLLTVEILSGNSQTWGKFGGKGELILSTATTLQNLNAYDPNCSTANADITFGRGCVDKLTLKKIRVYTGNKKSVEQALERVVYQRP